ncbi:MAG: large subunit ribosomal protein L17 [Limisphaerales bacterium]
MVHILFDKIAPKFQDRMGGYTRIVKIAGARKGDAAEMAILMWVDESLDEKAKAIASTSAKPKTAQDKAEDSPETPETSATEEEAPVAEEASGDNPAEASAAESAEAPAEKSGDAGESKEEK